MHIYNIHIFRAGIRFLQPPYSYSSICCPFSISFCGFETIFWFVSLRDRVCVQSQFVGDVSGTGWSGTPSQAQVSGSVCRLSWAFSPPVRSNCLLYTKVWHFHFYNWMQPKIIHVITTQNMVERTCLIFKVCVHGTLSMTESITFNSSYFLKWSQMKSDLYNEFNSTANSLMDNRQGNW